MPHNRQQIDGSKRLARVAAATLAAMLFADSASAKTPSPPDNRTGAPLLVTTEETCAKSGCHTTFGLDSGPGVLEILGPEFYLPGETYEITVSLVHDGQSRWGFEMTAIDDEFLVIAGNFTPADALSRISTSKGRQYIKHTLAGTANGQLDSMAWSFDWTAPEEDVGTVSFYATGNAANGNGVQSGDYIYTAVVALPEPSSSALGFVACGALLGLCSLRDRSRHSSSLPYSR